LPDTRVDYELRVPVARPLISESSQLSSLIDAIRAEPGVTNLAVVWRSVPQRVATEGEPSLYACVDVSVSITGPDAETLRRLSDRLTKRIVGSPIGLSDQFCKLDDLFPSSLFPRKAMELPPGWEYPVPDVAAGLLAELHIELPPGHRLFGCRVESVAACCGDDDTLFRHLDEPDRFTVVHLTCRGAQEIEGHPTIAFEGTFSEFLAREWQRSFELNPDLTLAMLQGDITGIQ